MYTLVLLLLSVMSNPLNHTDYQEFTQTLLQAPFWEMILERSYDGEFRQVAIVTNGHLPQGLHLRKFNQEVLVVKSEKGLKTANYITFEKAEGHESNVDLVFLYKGGEFTMNMIKEKGKWEIRNTRFAGEYTSINMLPFMACLFGMNR